MPRRNRHRIGDYLMQSDESGRIFYASEMVKDAYGNFMHQSEIGLETTRHPQEFVKARRDPYPMKDVRPDPIAITTSLAIPFFIGNTDIITPFSPSDSALGRDHSGRAGIGDVYITFTPTGDDRLIFEVA